ncbi:MAG TPA: hypothetical protein PLR08_03500 [bacterium]|nr:hypothetical protein [Candidatus Magasanikbacteria bacterium]USN52878.1 MAG: hypothetical protein H6759_02335 [Candidatus Nomurabacteria bacterium]HPF95587.1 hypothetical protein [bacterium]
MKSSLHITTDEKLDVVDISSELLSTFNIKEKDALGKPMDQWLDRQCLRSFLKDVLLAYRGEKIFEHNATLVINGAKHFLSMDMIPTIKKNDSLASKLQFNITIKNQAVDCTPLFKAVRSN